MFGNNILLYFSMLADEESIWKINICKIRFHDIHFFIFLESDGMAKPCTPNKYLTCLFLCKNTDVKMFVLKVSTIVQKSNQHHSNKLLEIVKQSKTTITAEFSTTFQ